MRAAGNGTDTPHWQAPARLLIEQMPATLWSTDRDLRVTSSLGGGLSTLGLTPNQTVGMTLFEYYRTDDAGYEPIAMHLRALRGESVTYEWTRQDRIFRVRLEPLRDGRGEVCGVVGVSLDITETRRIEQELLDNSARLQAIFSAFPDLYFEMDADGRILDYHAGRASDLYVPPSEFLGRRMWDLLPPEVSSQLQAAQARVLTTGASGAEEYALTIEGALRHFEARFSTLPAARVLVAIRNITERKQAEAALHASREALRALSGYLQSVREEERTRIAREVHDELGQALTSLKMDLSWLANRLAEAAPSPQYATMADRVEELTRLLERTIQTVRRISSELRPPLLDDLGLVAAIEWQAEEFMRRTGIACRITVPPELLDLSRDQATAMFRILQEVLTNVLRHACASAVDVVLRRDGDELVLEVHDDGRGIAGIEAENPRSLGLAGMRERAYLLGGAVRIEGRPGAGTTVTARIPLKGGLP